ncbi:HdeD family acid-resistance protein [Clostridium chrysemydis]|uniref:HdeD family acid-resistance protein n=1 Tax=Clostridium chrysemydis TaxID=2665504 RepID=UPI003F2A247B
MKTGTKALFIIEGILLAIVGILFFAYPAESLVNFTQVIGVLIIISGVISLFKGGEFDRRGLFILMGIINILFGLLLAFSPITSIEALVLYFGIWCIIRGIILLCGEFKYGSFGFNIRTIYTILLVVAGVVIIIYPITALIITPYIIGVYFILTAVFEIGLMFEL